MTPARSKEYWVQLGRRQPPPKGHRVQHASDQPDHPIYEHIAFSDTRYVVSLLCAPLHSCKA